MKNESVRKSISVDKPNYSPVWSFKQEDDGVLKLALYRGSTTLDITGQTVKLGIVRADKTLVELEDQSSFVINNNELDITLKNNILAIAGIAECDLQLVDASGKMTTASFFIHVNKKTTGTNNVGASNEIEALEKIKTDFKADVNSMKDEFETFKGAAIAEDKVTYFQNEINKANSQLEQKANYKDLVYVTPQMFGAKGDGVTDDTQAFQTAINSSNYIKIPFGTYLISDTLIINKGIDSSIVIEGYAGEILGNPCNNRPRMVILKAKENMSTPILKLLTTRNSRFSNFVLDGGGASSNFKFSSVGTIEYCMLLEDSPYNKFDSVNFKGALKSSVGIKGITYTNSFTNCAFSASQEFGYDSSTCPDHCTTWFYNCRFEGNKLGGMRMTGRLNGLFGCAFEGNLGNGLELGFTGLDTYDIGFYSCDIEGNLGNGVKINSNLKDITYDGGQIIGDSQATKDLFDIKFALDNVVFKTHMSVLSNVNIFTPSTNIWIRGDFPDSFMNCIKVANVFWSRAFGDKRDNYKEYIFTLDDISNPLNNASKTGGIITENIGIKINTHGKSVTSITGKVSDSTIQLKCRYVRCYNGGAKTEVVVNIPINSDGTFTLNSSTSVYGMMEYVYLFIHNDGTLTNKRIEVTELKGMLR